MESTLVATRACALVVKGVSDRVVGGAVSRGLGGPVGWGLGRGVGLVHDGVLQGGDAVHQAVDLALEIASSNSQAAAAFNVEGVAYLLESARPAGVLHNQSRITGYTDNSA